MAYVPNGTHAPAAPMHEGRAHVTSAWVDLYKQGRVVSENHRIGEKILSNISYSLMLMSYVILGYCFWLL